ncbi:GNAT family N-acetyltransferase [Leptospira sp. 201903071]|uniref:GNAT family N-acetyltransferase n=1 Tax=Leptospira ainazelensis TaxID=2810034 RepID=UPI001966AC22|nr:GNAT family N-acetyltransferase [Leptospira ainazelensis]MBM9501665.1 GNAT family N-acetyltransferase [Leptospira ainazelensis]
MNQLEIKIKPYEEKFREPMILLWERSVRATHDFVSLEDIEYFKSLVKNIDFSSFRVHCCFQEDQSLSGFIGVSENKIEMLFLEPKYIGKGIGKSLIEFAIEELAVTEVEVNEQNLNAVRFYSKFGFRTYDRTELDGEGKNYPILKMKLSNSQEKNEIRFSSL